jgi:hypothetical protein
MGDPLPVGVPDGVALAEAPIVKVADGVPEFDGVALGVPLPEVAAVPVGDPIAVVVAVCVSVPVRVTDSVPDSMLENVRVGEPLGVPERVPDKLPVGVGEDAPDAVCEVVPLSLPVRVPVCESAGGGDGIAEPLPVAVALTVTAPPGAVLDWVPLGVPLGEGVPVPDTGGDGDGVGAGEGVTEGGTHALHAAPGATTRTRFSPRLTDSATKSRPESSTATAVGLESAVPVEGPPASMEPPHEERTPAAIRMVPFWKSLRTRQLEVSAKKRAPQASTAAPCGKEMAPPTPRTLSSALPADPIPAMVVITSATIFSSRTRCPTFSTM